MNGDQTKWATEVLPDEAKEYTLRGMLSDFYNRKMTTIVVMTLGYSLLFMVLAVLCAIQFFKVEQTRDQILYAALFICLLQWLTLMKIFAWQFIHRNSIKRSIQRLEIRLGQFEQTLKK